MIRKLENWLGYLIITSTAPIKLGDWFLWNVGYSSQFRICTQDDLDEMKSFIRPIKIVAHLPLGDNPWLENLLLLPDLSVPESLDLPASLLKTLFFNKQIDNPYSTGSQEYTSFEKGYIDGFKKGVAELKIPTKFKCTGSIGKLVLGKYIYE